MQRACRPCRSALIQASNNVERRAQRDSYNRIPTAGDPSHRKCDGSSCKHRASGCPGSPLGTSDDSYLAALAAAAEEALAAIGLQSGDTDAGWHCQALLDSTGLRVDAADLTFIPF